MTTRFWLGIAACMALVACGDDGSDDADPGCAIYSDFLAQEENPTDTRALDVLRDVERTTEDDEVRSFAVALRARLEDNDDITASYEGLAKACGLV